MKRQTKHTMLSEQLNNLTEILQKLKRHRYSQHTYTRPFTFLAWLQLLQPKVSGLSKLYGLKSPFS